jgi:hypothetical protein
VPSFSLRAGFVAPLSESDPNASFNEFVAKGLEFYKVLVSTNPTWRFGYYQVASRAVVAESALSVYRRSLLTHLSIWLI